MKPQHELHKNWFRHDPVFLFSYEDKDIYSWRDHGDTVYAAMFPDHEAVITAKRFYYSSWFIQVEDGDKAIYRDEYDRARFPPEVLEIINAHRNLLA